MPPTRPPTPSKSPTRRRRKPPADARSATLLRGDGEQPFRQLVERLRPEVDRRLRHRFSALARRAGPLGVEPTVRALRDLVLRGGKRFRAGLVVAAYAGVRPRASLDPALDAAAAVELLHAYLLAQDDWMDRDQQRRGGPSVHAALAAAYGREDLGDVSAIISSDFGWSLAVLALSRAAAPPRRVVRALQALCCAHEDVLLGQQIDVLACAPDVETMHALKTESYTVRGPLLVGAALAGADEQTERALRAFAAPLGVAFQLRDDLLGVFAPEDKTGKAIGSDLQAGKRTAVTAAAEQCLDRSGRRAYRAVFGKASASRAELLAAAGHVERCGAKARVEHRLAELCGRANRRARRLPLSRRARGWLSDAVAWVAAPIPTVDGAREG